MSVEVVFSHRRETYLFGMRRLPSHPLPRYSFTYGYDRETATGKIKQLIQSIRNGDFKETCGDFPDPAGAAIYYQWLYAPILGKKCSPITKDDDLLSFHLENFTPNPAVELVQRDCWISEQGREYGYHTAWAGDTWGQMKKGVLDHETDQYNWRCTPNGKRATTTEEKASFIWTDFTKLTKVDRWYVTVSDGPLYGSHTDKWKGPCIFGTGACSSHERALAVKERLEKEIPLDNQDKIKTLTL